jgi:DNA-binding MurR/RpiR family transcriptional regulator
MKFAVKLAKKLSYSGFADMRNTLSAGRADEVSETFLPLDTAEDGDILPAAERLAQLFWERRSTKHVLEAACMADMRTAFPPCRRNAIGLPAT